jgi:peptidoglycan/xylan/chitin deacetylase (PgdA/CDA1 family)
MKGKKELLAKILYYSGIHNIARLRNKSRLIVFNYHRIKSNDNNFATPFDDDVFGPTVSQFKEQIKWLKQNAKILSEKELIDILDAKRVPSGLNVLITFDDGYRDNYTLAYPVLKELNVPAILFIPTNLINTRQIGWWDIIAYLIKNTKKPYIIFEDEKFLLAVERKKTIDFFNNKMKLEKAEKTVNLLKNLAEACEADMPDFDKQDSQLMTWEQIREVSKNNISIGAHTHTHRVLSALDLSTQKEEMTLSKTILEQEIGNRVNSIAYPVGDYQHFTQESCNIAEQVGYKLGFSFNTGVNYIKEINYFDIKRVGPPRDVIMLVVTTTLPSIFTFGRKH